MTLVKLVGVRLEKSAQKPRTTVTNVEHFSIPKGHLLLLPATRQLSTNVSFTSCSSSTSFADKEIEKGGQGPQEKTTCGDLSDFFMKAANSRLLAHIMRESINNGNEPLCKEMRELPVALKFSSDCDRYCVKIELDNRTMGAEGVQGEGADVSFVTHKTFSTNADDFMTV
jgi:hypothetical protein